MRVLMISPRLESGGLQRYLIAVARGLVERGHEVVVAYGGEGSAQERWLEERSIGVECVARSILDARVVPQWILGVRRLLRKHPCDVVYAHSLTAGGVAALAAPRTPRIVTLHGALAGRERRDARLARLLPARLVAASKALALQFQSFQPRLRIDVIYSGIDVAAFEQLSKEQAPALPAGRPRFVCVARHDPPKGVDLAIEAFAAIESDFPAATLVLVGDGPASVTYKARARELGLESRIVFTGDLVNPAPAIAGADVAVLASRQEGGVPLAVLEALALAVPVVATTVGGVPEIIESGVNGELVPSEDVGALASALAIVGADLERARALGAAGRQLVQREFSIERMVDRYEAVLEEVAARR
jgi:glycosyltransferase involved in cell wall biosynthesis